MATTLLIPSESFLYTGDKPIFYLLDWYTGVGEMDRFFPSSKKQENWSRNYKRPLQQSPYNNRGNPNSSGATGSPSKVPSSTSSRGRMHRDHSQTETSYSQGITLRPEDLLMGNVSRMSISPSSGYAQSNPATPGTRPQGSPGAYLFPSVSIHKYGNRRLNLSNSATELHVSTTVDQPMIRRASDGNYNTYETEQEPDIRFLKDPRTNVQQQQVGKSNRKPPYVPQDSVETSNSSISSFSGNGTTTSTTTNDVTSGSNGDADTSYSSISSTSYSGADDDPTSTSSPALSSSTSSPSTTSSAKNTHTRTQKPPHVSTESTCPYCRLHNSSSDSGDYCQKTSCSVSSCCSPVTVSDKDRQTKTELTGGKLDKKIVPRSPYEKFAQRNPSLNLISTTSKSLSSLKKEEDESMPFGKLELTRLKSDTSPHINLSDGTFAPTSMVPSTTSPIKYRRLIRRAPKPPITLKPVTKPSTNREISDVKTKELSYLEKPNLFPVKDPAKLTSPTATHHKPYQYFRDKEHGPSTMRPKYDVIRKSRAKGKSNFLEDEDKINLRVYSPNTFSYHHRLSHYANRTPSPYNVKESYNRRTFNKRHDSYPGNSNYSILATESVENRRSPRYPMKFRSIGNIDDADDEIQRGNRRFGRSLSHMNLDHKQQSQYSASPQADVHKPFPYARDSSKPSPMQKSSLVSNTGHSKTTLAENTLHDKTNLTEDSSLKTKNLKAQDPRHKNCRKASQILHTKVTLVKREPISSRRLPHDINAVTEIHQPSEKLPHDINPVTKIHQPSGTENDAVDDTSQVLKTELDTKLPTKNVETTITIEDTSADMAEDIKNESTVIEMQNSDDTKDKELLDVSIKDSTTITSSIDSLTTEKTFNSPEDDSTRIDIDSSEISKSEISAKSNSYSFSLSTTTNSESKSKDDSTIGNDITGSAETLKNTKSPTEDEEYSSSPCLCGSSVALSKDTETSEKTEGVSEEECSMCQKERRRALSPEVLVLTAAISKEEEDAVSIKGIKNSKSEPKSHRKPLPAIPIEASSDDSLTPPTESFEKPLKSPDYLIPEFDFEPEIIHKANPSVDEAVDEKTMRHSEAFRRLSEDEFIATLNIHDAARKGDLHVVKLLVKKDSKQMETVDERGWTPLHLAAAHGHTEIVKYLSQEGAHKAALDPSSYTAMHLAAMNGHNQCVDILLQMGVDVDCVTAEGFTPLHLAAMNAHLECCQTLLHWGASLNKRDALGRTVQDMVEEYGLDDVSHIICRFMRQYKKFQEMFQIIQPALGDNGGGSFIASLSRLNESDLPKEILDLLSEFSEESGLDDEVGRH